VIAKTTGRNRALLTATTAGIKMDGDHDGGKYTALFF
jgi:hypothetical protein